MDSDPMGSATHEFRPDDKLGIARNFEKRFVPEIRDQQRE